MRPRNSGSYFRKEYPIIVDLLALSETITFLDIFRFISSIISISLTPSRNNNYRLPPAWLDICERRKDNTRSKSLED